MIFLKFALSILNIIISGYAILRLFSRSKKELPLGEVSILSFGIGTAFVGLETFLLALFKRPLSLGYILLFSTALIIAAALRLKKDFFCCDKSWWKQKLFYSPFAIFLLILIIWEIFYVFLESASIPFNAWDAWASWGFKAKIFFQEKAFPVRYCTGFPGFAHPDYPVLIPFAETYIYLFLGQIHEPLIKLFCSFFYAGMIVLFYYQLKRQFKPEFALAGCLVLATIPNLANLASTAYMDVPIAFYITGGILYIWRYLKEKNNLFLILGSLFTGLGMWVKNEGFSFWLALVLAALMICFFLKLNIEKKRFLFVISFIPFLIYFPWLVFKYYFRLGVTYFQGPLWGVFDLIKERLPMILNIWARSLLDAGKWNILWVGFIIALIWFFIRPREKLAWIFLLITFFQSAFYFIIYIIWPITLVDLELQILNSVDRLPLQLVTIILFFICLQSGERWKSS
ncbi:MAG: glycosyltransferase family 39 protein [Candidatus Omnitrophota bacterium]|jgi:hypothetical protein